MKKYKHLFFDLDHTLWDFDRASEETLIDLFRKYQLQEIGIASEKHFLEAFVEVNYELWDLHNQAKADKLFIRENRFPMVFERLGIGREHLPPMLGDDYLRVCPTKPHLIEAALEVLEVLSEKYQLHIITNGFDDSQALKMKNSGIHGFFEVIVTSECTGHTKPAREIFDYALKKAEARPEESLMIGDNPDTDIKGALLVGMDAILYNPTQKPHSYRLAYEITHLSELIDIL